MAEQETDRTSVRTYVPAYQKEEWNDHAEALDMSLSEYVRTMVQAGRRGFEGAEMEAPERNSEDTDPEGVTPGGDGLESTILDALDDRALEFDELVDEIADDFRSDVDEALSQLEDRREVEHDRLDGGFRMTDDG